MANNGHSGRSDNPAVYGLTVQQRRLLPQFAALKAFEAIGTCGGIRRAAEALSVDHAAVSRHLRALEEWAGVPLFDRASGVAGQLTPHGARFHRTIARSLAEISAAALDFMPQQDDRNLVLWCAPGLASEWLTGRIGNFSAAFPDIQLELQPIEITPGAVGHDVDAYIHYVIDAQKADLDPGFRTQELARPRILAVASPSFVADLPPVATPADLLNLPLLHEANFDQWRRWFESHGVAGAENLGGPRYWQGHLTLAAARRGQGLALANTLLVADSIRRGELVEVGDFAPVHLGSYMLTTRRTRWRGLALTDFRRWIERAIVAPD
nr:LysR substrate-binding domain-containing protein [uncultured Sphingomonas sp.]